MASSPTMSRQPKYIPVLLTLAGTVDLWILAGTTMLLVQIVTGFVAAACFGAAGITLERRYNTDYVDQFVQRVYDRQQPSEGDTSP